SLMLPVMTGLLILIGVGINTWLQDAVNWGIWLPICLAATVAYFIGLCFTHPKLKIMLVPMLICTGIGILYAMAGLRLLLSLFSWWYLLVPTIAVALFYVAMMYLKDSRSVHPLVAGFLGLLRCLAYTILAVVFLLPGCQEFDVTEYHA